MEDKRAHERINNLESAVTRHFDEHSKFEQALSDNTTLTKQIADNTAELVVIVKSAKGLRSFVIWVTPIAIAVAAVWAWVKGRA